MCALACVDEDEVSEDEASEDEVEADGFGRDVGKKCGERDGGEGDSGEESGAVAMVEAVAGFEDGLVSRLGVEEAVGGVERPDGDEHGEEGGDGKLDVAGPCDEPGPECGYCGGLHGSALPECEGGAVADCRLGWCCGGHLFILVGVGECGS